MREPLIGYKKKTKKKKEKKKKKKKKRKKKTKMERAWDLKDKNGKLW